VKIDLNVPGERDDKNLSKQLHPDQATRFQSGVVEGSYDCKTVKLTMQKSDHAGMLEYAVS